MTEQAAERVLQLVGFLADYDARRNPPVHDIASYDLFLKRDGDVPEVPGIQVVPAGEAWLGVDFLELPALPGVPEELVGVVSTAGLPPLERPVPSEDAEDDARARAETWLASVWDPWSETYRDAEAAKLLYRNLFEARARLDMERESLELVWGFGRLRWTNGGVKVDHPLITVPVEVDLDGETEQLRVRPDGPPDIEVGCLAGLQLADKPALLAARQANAASTGDGERSASVDVWSDEDLAATLRRLAHAVDDHGVVVDAASAQPADGESAVIDLSWVLYLRRRRPDYQGFLEELRELYASGVIPPDPLSAVVIDTPSELIDGEKGSSLNGTGEPLLLPLATNEEQQRIVHLARSRAGVTVQGPPGTGKSHTIANVISHYVAQGKRVLVTAEKEQALKVLGDKIPEGIRNLTVSVLGADEEGRRRLETAISEIQTRVTGLDRALVDRNIARLYGDLDETDRAIAAATERIFRNRAAEVAVLDGQWLAGNDLTPSAAARWVAENAETRSYITDELAVSTAPPVTPADLAEFVRLIEEVTPRVAEDAAFDLPDLDELPTDVHLVDVCRQLDDIRGRLASAAPEITSWGRVDGVERETLEALAADLRGARDWRTKTAGTWLFDVIGAIGDPLVADEWRDLAVDLRREREAAMVLRRSLAAVSVTVPSAPEHGFIDTLRAAHEQLRDRGKIRMFSRDEKRALALCSVNGREPVTPDHVQACIHQIELDETRRRIRTRWVNRIEPAGGPALPDEAAIETALGEHLDSLDKALAWPGSTWPALRERSERLGIRSSLDGDPDSLARLVEVLELAERRAEERRLQAELDALDAYLERGRTEGEPSPLWRLLLDALRSQSFDAWATQRANVESLHAIGPSAKRLRDLRRRVADVTPLWATRILDDPAAAGDPGSLQATWQWRQLEGWVTGIARAGAGDPQGELEELTTRRRRIVADLVADSAWRRLADNLNDQHRQALNRYLKAVTRYGKTGGKFAMRWITEMRAALNDSKSAVPVWIMPVSRALSSFRPEQQPPFDVLIIDEASQIGIHALPLLSLARTAIVVGDDKQTSPENVGMNQQAIFDLLDIHLSAVPAYKTLFDPSNSLYDLAFQKFPDVVMLTEHFRCLPPIIEFSNTYAYDGRIIPLRDRPPHAGWAAVGAVKVTDGYRIGDLNPPEAEAVVDLVEQLCADPAYDGMSFGVISLLGSSQSKLIWDRLYDRLGPSVLAERDIRCGEPANFQGDERDVMVLSTVVATDPNNPTARIAAATRTADQRRINVAASRARNQMWVVHSIDPDRFSPGDLRGELIRHCQNPGLLEGAVADLEARCESDFERQVVRRILAAGYRRIRVQHPVGRYRLDLVIEGPESRLAVECDGDRWHGEDVWHQDRARQEVLERAGWTFVRVRGSAFYRDPNRALEPLWQRLDELNIPMGEDWPDTAQRAMVRTVEMGEVPVPVQPQGRRTSTRAPRHVPAAPAAPEVSPAPTSEVSAAPVEPANAPPTRAAVTASALPSAPRRAGELPLDTARSSRTATTGRLAFEYHDEWMERRLTPVDIAGQQSIIEDLAEIITAEGPMHALRAYQLYTRAAGGQRVGKEMKRCFNRAVNAALNTGDLAQVKDNLEGQIEKTLFIPGSPPVRVRERGPRALTEIPRSEIATVIDALDLRGRPAHELKREVLAAFELTKLTESASSYLDECVNYRWS